MTSLYTLLIIVAIVVYMVIRQFQERALTPMSLLLFPLLVIYYTYIDIISELAKSPISNALLIVIMIVGLLLGGLLGIYRGNQTLMRFDKVSQRVMAKACTINIVLYLATFVIRIAAGVMLYMHLNSTSVILALLLALLTTFFLGNIVMEKIVLYLRSRSVGLNPSSAQVARW